MPSFSLITHCDATQCHAKIPLGTAAPHAGPFIHVHATAEFLPCDSEKKVHVLAPGQRQHFEALIDVNEDEAAEDDANEWRAAVLRAANKHM